MSIRLLISVLLAVVVNLIMYFLTSANLVIAYRDGTILPTIKLLMLGVIVFGSLTIVNTYTINQLFSFTKKRWLFFLFSISLAFYLTIVSRDIRNGFLLPLSYVRMGDYLRDVWGINWYYMDWGGWSIMTAYFFESIYTAILLRIGKRIQ